MQNAEELDRLLATLKSNQRKLADEHGRYTPLAVKIAPDLESSQIESIAALLLARGIDGVIATNTTLSRAGVETLPHANEAGGLSGAPLKHKATMIVRRLNAVLQGALPIIAVGGIMCAADAREKIEAGASLVQIYSGLVYRGPDLVREIGQALCTSNGPSFKLGFSMIKDQLIAEIDGILPQTQCRQCGFAGCRPYAAAIAEGLADINQCPPGGERGILRLAKLLGVSPKPLNTAHGFPKPRAVALINEQACIGCTLCILACPVDAIVGAAKQAHTVITEECTGCELCIAPCPVDCISMVPPKVSAS